MRYLILGGTGTLGRAVIKKIDPQHSHITVISRDELKQKKLKKDFPHVECFIGDIKDKSSLAPHFEGKDVVLNFAALKHVDMCEANPRENMKTNVLGNFNVVDLSKEYRVPFSIFSSTDKAVLPINAYGFAKAISENYYLSHNHPDSEQLFSVFRWGNVVGSRGSVVNSFAKTLELENKIYLTDAEMTRFWINIDEAAQYMLTNYTNANPDQVMIPGMRSAKVVNLAAAVARCVGVDVYEVEITGLRPGEKIHECLWTSHDECVRSDNTQEIPFDELCDMVGASL